MKNSNDIIEEALSLYERMKDLPYYYGSSRTDELDVQTLSEANLNHILKNAENNGIIIISSDRDRVKSDNPNCDLGGDFQKYLSDNGITNPNKSVENNWLKERNKKAYEQLYQIIRSSEFSFSKVYGGYNGKDGVNASYEASFIIYSVNRKGEQVPFENLFELGKKLCGLFKQEAFYAQAPGQAPNYYDSDGNKVNESSTKNVKLNRFGETFFTTAKPKKGANVQRFTSDIIFENTKKWLSENYRRDFGIEYVDRMRRSKNGEYLFV